MLYEKRRKELFKGFAQGKTISHKANKLPTHTPKEFIVYNPQPKKTLKKSSSQYKKPPTPIPQRPKERSSIKLPTQMTFKTTEKPLKETLRTLTEGSQTSVKGFINQTTPKGLLCQKITAKKGGSLQAIPRKDFPSQNSTAATYKKPPMPCSNRRLPVLMKAKTTVIEKKPLVLIIDLRKLKKQMSNSQLNSKREERRLKVTRISRQCSLVLEETVKEECLMNRSRSFSCDSFVNTTTERL